MFFVSGWFNEIADIVNICEPETVLLSSLKAENRKEAESFLFEAEHIYLSVLFQRQIASNDFRDDESSGRETEKLLDRVLKPKHGFREMTCARVTAATDSDEGQLEAMTAAQARRTPGFPPAAAAENAQAHLHGAKHIAMKFAISS